MNASLTDRCDRCGSLMRPMVPDQHAAVEGVYRDLAAQLEWPRGSGNKRDAWTWHELMVQAYVKYKGWALLMLPSLDGEGLVMTTRQKQSRLTVRQGAELVHFARAWAIENNVKLTERKERAA